MDNVFLLATFSKNTIHSGVTICLYILPLDRSSVSDIGIVADLACFTFHGKRYSVKGPGVLQGDANTQCQTLGAKLAEINYIQELHG